MNARLVARRGNYRIVSFDTNPPSFSLERNEPDCLGGEAWSLVERIMPDEGTTYELAKMVAIAASLLRNANLIPDGKL